MLCRSETPYADELAPVLILGVWLPSLVRMLQRYRQAVARTARRASGRVGETRAG